MGSGNRRTQKRQRSGSKAEPSCQGLRVPLEFGQGVSNSGGACCPIFLGSENENSPWLCTMPESVSPASYLRGGFLSPTHLLQTRQADTEEDWVWPEHHSAEQEEALRKVCQIPEHGLFLLCD